MTDPQQPRIEYGQLMPGGGYSVWNTDSETEEISPLAKRIAVQVRRGNSVYRRRIIVVEDWTEVTEVTEP